MQQPPDTVERTRSFYDATGSRDIEKVRELLRDDVVFHVGGDSPIAGDHRGADVVIELFSRVVQETRKTFSLQLGEVIGNRRFSAARHRWTASRAGTDVDMHNLVVLRWDDDGRIAERWEFLEDQGLHDRFWSST